MYISCLALKPFKYNFIMNTECYIQIFSGGTIFDIKYVYNHIGFSSSTNWSWNIATNTTLALDSRKVFRLLVIRYLVLNNIQSTKPVWGGFNKLEIYGK